jgi:hypothetical protein
MTDKLQEGEWETEEETLASRGNGQYEPYLVVSKDEADARVAELEAENQRLREAALAVTYHLQWFCEEDGVLELDPEVVRRLEKALARECVGRVVDDDEEDSND